MATKLAEYGRLLRIYQWHKNGFVLIGFFALGDYQNLPLLGHALLNTIAFCLASSSVYIFNDFYDIAEDRRHPKKKLRPLAAGTIAVRHALLLSALLAAGSLVLAYDSSTMSLFIIAAYFVNNMLYTLFIKGYPIIDVFLIAFGFMLRIFAGTAGIGIFVSEWLILTGFMVSLLIGFSKRYAELSNNPEPHFHREVLKQYTPDLLKYFVMIMSSASIVTYSLYTVSPRSIELHGSTHLIYTTPIVIFGILRFLNLVFVNQSGEDPAGLVFKDKYLLLTIFAWAITYSLIIL